MRRDLRDVFGLDRMEYTTAKGSSSMAGTITMFNLMPWIRRFTPQ